MFVTKYPSRLLCIALAVSVAVGIGSNVAGADETKAPASQPVEVWSQKFPSFWPQLVLTNDASFQGHTALQGASAFLMKMPDGEIVLGTAKHLIKEPGGVNPPIALPDLDRVLTRWQVCPRTRQERAIDVKGIAGDRSRETRHDWLLLHLADPTVKLPSTPLVPRLRPAEVGETVYLVGVPYTNKNSAQIIYKGVVTARPKKNYFTYEFTPPVAIAGFSGAPIVDSGGLLVGHGVSMTPELKKKDGLEIEFGGEDAALAVELWEHRMDQPPAQPAQVVHLDLPPGWTAKPPQMPEAIKFAFYPGLTAYVEILGISKADLDDRIDLKAWAALTKKESAKIAMLKDRQESELTGGSVGGRPTVEYNVEGSLPQGIKVRYRIIMLELNGCYLKAVCWTTPSHWDASQPKFEEIVKALND